MALNFPSNPILGDIHTQDSNMWTYDGYRWTLNVTQTLDGLSDIVTTPVIENGSSLVYNSTMQMWEPKVDTSSIAYAIALS